jgi:hypothetical protein
MGYLLFILGRGSLWNRRSVAGSQLLRVEERLDHVGDDDGGRGEKFGRQSHAR